MPGSGTIHPPNLFWNLSNHPWDVSWSRSQKKAAMGWAGPGVHLQPRDHPFPPVDPGADLAGILALAGHTVDAIKAAGGRPGEPILVQGEFSLVLALVPWLQEEGLVPLCATSRRVAHEELRPDGTVLRSNIFQFVQFRRYPNARDLALRSRREHGAE